MWTEYYWFHFPKNMSNKMTKCLQSQTILSLGNSRALYKIMDRRQCLVCGVPFSEQRGQKELSTDYHSLNEIKVVEKRLCECNSCCFVRRVMLAQ